MLEIERVQNALRDLNRDLPTAPPVARIAVEPYEDFRGEDSLRISVLFNDAATDQQIAEASIPIKRKVIDVLDRLRVNLFPYFFFLHENEYQNPGGV